MTPPVAHPRRAPGDRLFRLFGVDIRVHPSWLLFALFVAWSLATGSLPMAFEGLPERAYWAMAVLVVLGLAASIVLHEMGHTLVARSMGLPIERITLFAFGGVAELTEEPKAARTELLMAIAGPIVSVGLALGLAFGAGVLEAIGARPEIVGAFSFLASLNLTLALFNMIPAFPLDGGRVLRALVWMRTKSLRRATEVAARSGQWFGLALMGAGLLLMLRGGLAGGLWWILIGAFVRWMASSSRADAAADEILTPIRVREVMTDQVETAPADMPVDRFVEEKLLRSRHGFYPVIAGGRWIGAVVPEQVAAVPRAAWASTPVGGVCRPPEQTVTVDAEASLAEALERMRRTGSAYLPVVDQGELVGILSLRDVLSRLSLEKIFGGR